MSATELAIVVEGWATLVGLFVVIAGAVFAGVQLRADAKARRFQAVSAVIEHSLPPNIEDHARVLRSAPIPPGSDLSDLSDEQSVALDFISTRYARLGALLWAGHLKDDDVFFNFGLARTAINLWEIWKSRVRSRAADDPFRALAPLEFLAARAQVHLVRKGVEQYGSIPHFDADPAVLDEVRQRIAAAKAGLN